jgi:hypothetical protein
MKVEVNEERSLCGFVTKIFFNMWQKIKWARRWICLILWKEHFSIYDGGWSGSVQVLEVQLKLYFGNMDAIRKVCKVCNFAFGTMEGARGVQQFWKFRKVNSSAHQFDCILELQFSFLVSKQ